VNNHLKGMNVKRREGANKIIDLLFGAKRKDEEEEEEWRMLSQLENHCRRGIVAVVHSSAFSSAPSNTVLFERTLC
jgi:hypothetical protein